MNWHVPTLIPRFVLLLVVAFSLSACEEDKDDVSFERSGEISHSNFELIKEAYPEFFNANLLIDRDSIDADGSRVCAYRLTGATGFPGLYLDCWGSHTPRGDLVGDKEPQANGLSLGSAHVCVSKTSHNGTGIYCEGANGNGQSLNPAISEGMGNGHYTYQPRFLTSGDQHNCVIDQLGIYCWGGNTYGQLDAPEVIEPIFLASAENHNCVIDSAQSAHCWGNNQAGQSNVPDDLINVNYLALGKDFSCALYGADKASNAVRCWGNTQWEVAAPESLGWEFINAGDDHICAVNQDADGYEVTCWGNNGSGQLNVPELAQTGVRTLVSGTGFSCALSEYLGFPAGVGESDLEEIGDDPEILYLGAVCWGSNSSGQLDAPPFLCHGFHASAKLTDERFCPAL